MENKDKLVISYDYPHNLLRHMNIVLKGHPLNFLLKQDAFLVLYQERFPESFEELGKLKSAYAQNIISGFLHKEKEPMWKKRVFINVALKNLLKELKESEAVEIIETMMYLCGWHFTINLQRKWEVAEEDKAKYHEFKTPRESVQNFNMEAKGFAEKQRKEIERMGEELDISFQSNSFPEEGAAEYRNETSILDARIENKNRAQVFANGQQNKSFVQSEKGTQKDSQLPSGKAPIKFQSHMNGKMLGELKKAARGNTDSQCSIGDFYGQEGTEHTDYSEAAKWYHLAANQGSYRAQLSLGRIYDSEKIGTGDDKKIGIEYYRKLAENGFPTAQCILGLKYYFGDGVKENHMEAVKWLNKSAAQGYPAAQRYLGDYYARIGDEVRSNAWYQQAIAGGDSVAKKIIRRK